MYDSMHELSLPLLTLVTVVVVFLIVKFKKSKNKIKAYAEEKKRQMIKDIKIIEKELYEGEG